MGIIKFLLAQVKSVFGFIWHIIYETLSDIKFLFYELPKKLIKNEQIVDPEKYKEFKAEISTWSIGSLLKESWPWILACVFCIAIGYVLGLRWAEIQCNNYIIEEFVNPTLRNFTSMFNQTY